MNFDADSKNFFKIFKNPKMKINTKKDPQKTKKIHQIWPNHLLSEFRPIMNFDADVKHDFKINFLTDRGPKGPYNWP